MHPPISRPAKRRKFRSVAIVLAHLSIASAVRADEVATVFATDDAFVRELDPSSNFGGAGLLCVAGADSVNGSGMPRGRFDSLLKFECSAAIAGFDAVLGAGNWELTDIQLNVTMVAAAENPLFPRGPGNFNISWLSDDAWSEGTGTPNSPTPGGGDELTWDFLQQMLSGATERLLGTFAYGGSSGGRQFTLSRDALLISDLIAAGLVTLHCSPQTSTIGMPFHSLDFSDPLQQPWLTLTATPKLPGDLNCDALVNELDTAPFVLALLDPAGYSDAYPACIITHADMDQNGVLDGRDIAGFIAAVLPP